ncbi:MAG: hypothetical protein OHK0017_10320 [Patescibacteria group bacterium]
MQVSTEDGRNIILQKAQVALDLGKHDLALKYYNEAIANNPNSPEAWHGLAWSLMEQGKLKEAEKTFESGLAYDPLNAQLLLSLLHLYVNGIFNKKKVEDAVKTVLDNYPHYWNVHYYVAYYYLNYEPSNKKAIVMHAHKSMELNPAHEHSVHLNAYVTDTLLFNKVEAERLYLESLRLNSLISSTHNDFAIFLMRNHRYQEATLHFNAVKKLNPNVSGLEQNLLECRLCSIKPIGWSKFYLDFLDGTSYSSNIIKSIILLPLVVLTYPIAGLSMLTYLVPKLIARLLLRFKVIKV